MAHDQALKAALQREWYAMISEHLMPLIMAGLAIANAINDVNMRRALLEIHLVDPLSPARDVLFNGRIMSPPNSAGAQESRDIFSTRLAAADYDAMHQLLAPRWRKPESYTEAELAPKAA
jgi:hypothetical protein